MEKNWKIKNEPLSEEEIASLKSRSDKYHPVVLKLLEERGIKDKEALERFFNFDYEKDIPDPFLLLDMEKAVGRISEARDRQERVAIFGDYDADGVTATALLFDTLKELGFENLETYIPDRQTEGYGLNIQALEYIKEKGVGLIITVDCGITNREEVDKAQELGMEVIITDHHHIPGILPKSLAIIHPARKKSEYPHSYLSGVGVAFKLAQALYQKIDPKKMDKLKWSLDLVAIGTIADCVPLLGENRTLVKFGLIVLEKTKRVGLQEIFKVGRISISEEEKADSEKVAFQISPRINAAGRMDHANISFKLLIEDNPVQAHNMALDLESCNQERQKITAEIVRGIRIMAENYFKDRKVILASNPHWSVGILGLAAGKICDEFQKPTIVLKDQGKLLAGSLRSIPEVNIIETLEECSELLIKFGGHSQAAGMQIQKDQIDAFYKKFSRLVEKKLKGKEIKMFLEIDMELSPEDINWDFLHELRKTEPFGEGNPRPVFLTRDMLVEEVKVVGNGKKHLKLILRGEKNSPKIFDSIGFSLGEKFADITKNDKIDIVYTLEEDKWNGNKKIQLKLIDLKRTNE